jgi:pilus assembly protein Flp/PilA
MLPYVLAWLSQFDREDEGQGMVEYALILVLVSVVAIVTLTILGDDVAAVFKQISGKLGAAE